MRVWGLSTSQELHFVKLLLAKMTVGGEREIPVALKMTASNKLIAVLKSKLCLPGKCVSNSSTKEDFSLVL